MIWSRPSGCSESARARYRERYDLAVAVSLLISALNQRCAARTHQNAIGSENAKPFRWLVQGAADGQASPVEDVGIDHGRFDVLVAQKFLDGADVVVVLQEVGSKAVAQGVGCGSIADSFHLTGFGSSVMLRDPQSHRTICKGVRPGVLDGRFP